MNIHLIRTDEYSQQELFDLRDFLLHFHPPYDFIVKEKPYSMSLKEELGILDLSDPSAHTQLLKEVSCSMDMISEIKIYPVEDHFDICNRYRRKHRLTEDEIVILLSGEGNELNWFTMADENNKSNIFIHTAVWEFYTGVDQRYAVGYQVVSAILKHAMFHSMRDAYHHFHKDTRGCMMDFCENKKQISIKMRTADICGDCQKIIQQQGISAEIVKYTLEVMEFIRTRILQRNRYNYLKPEEALEVRGYMQKVYLPQLGSKEVPLTSAERAVYLLFLKHPEGIKVADIERHREELSIILHRLSRSDSKDTINSAVDKLCDRESNSLSEKMARIKQKFVDELGDTIARPYYISGPNGGAKKISLPREFVSYRDTSPKAAVNRN